ncbi:type IV secretion system DNA-binding domain-containing protein [Candidatus Falkowbacteria bacterium]|nr:MAG: type IV secretion system DNA-binding domain-containing protein [Candidatus Falkowbacteria bacterium]
MSDLALFAETTYRNQHRRFGIKTDDRRRHMYLIGKTGMGKSTILENMIIDDIRAGRGVAVVDPHGDLAEKVIQYIPSNRINDVIYFNPADVNYPIAFNVVEQVAPHLRHLVASGLIGVFQKLWADSWGPRLEYILRNSILAILDYPNSTLLAVTRMLSDKSFRKKVIDNIQDPVVKSFWTKEFAGYADKFAAEAVSPIQNKVGQFLSSSLIRNIVGQTNSSIDLREVMDEGKILIMNLSKGRIGEDNSELLGSMVITKIQLAAMSRVNVHEEERRDFYLYVDEFQNFATDSFANILSEARKYRLNLIMGHQYIEQLSDKVKAAVFGNVGTLVVFRIGATDAEELVKEFTPVFTEEDLVNLPKYSICLKLMIDGVASDPFSARGLAPLKDSERTQNEEKVIRNTRERYSAPREEVEEKIMRWHAEEETPRITVSKNQPSESIQPIKPTSAVKPMSQPISQKINSEPINQVREVSQNPSPQPQAMPILDPSVYKYEAICSRCQKTTRVPFKPDGVRPIFCKECLTILRQEKELSTNQRKALKQKEIEQLSKRPIYSASFTKPQVSPQEINKPIFEPVAPVEQSSPRPLSLSELSAEVPSDFHGNKINQTILQPTIEKTHDAVLNNDISSPREQHNHTHGSLQPGQSVRFN